MRKHEVVRHEFPKELTLNINYTNRCEGKACPGWTKGWMQFGAGTGAMLMPFGYAAGQAWRRPDQINIANTGVNSPSNQFNPTNEFNPPPVNVSNSNTIGPISNTNTAHGGAGGTGVGVGLGGNATATGGNANANADASAGASVGFNQPPLPPPVVIPQPIPHPAPPVPHPAPMPPSPAPSCVGGLIPGTHKPCFTPPPNPGRPRT